ncbi:hypothetical protein V6N12_024785 [Hibiscus sabdariffa]|uniref:Uncharacterized protein n=1 Tax=Hibiscus sabdariffa TaxID=183260 RepID=A0ABR2B9J8_9ROSI
MGVSNMKTWLVCMAIICMVAAVEVLPVDAAATATSLDGGASNLGFNRRLLQVPANPWTRGCSRIFRCRGGGGSGVQGKQYSCPDTKGQNQTTSSRKRVRVQGREHKALIIISLRNKCNTQTNFDSAFNILHAPLTTKLSASPFCRSRRGRVKPP